MLRGPVRIVAHADGDGAAEGRDQEESGSTGKRRDQQGSETTVRNQEGPGSRRDEKRRGEKRR
jgi:hypothetical protein